MVVNHAPVRCSRAYVADDSARPARAVPERGFPALDRALRYAYLSTSGRDPFVQACIAFCASAQEKGSLADASETAAATRRRCIFDASVPPLSESGKRDEP